VAEGLEIPYQMGHFVEGKTVMAFS